MADGSENQAVPVVSSRDRTEIYLGGILNGESGTADAKGELLSAMKFWDGKSYVSAANGNTDVITQDSIRQISIDVPEGLESGRIDFPARICPAL